MHRGITKMGPDRFNIRVRATCPRTGRAKEVERRITCRSMREALVIQARLRAELEAQLAGAVSHRVRLKDFAPSWLGGRIAAGKLKPSSATKIASVWDLHIEPAAIADLYVDAITPGDVEAWLDAIRCKRFAPGKGKAERRKAPTARPYAAGAVLGFYRVLRTIVTAATARLRLPNPCDGVETPAAGARRDNFLTADELRQVLDQVAKQSPSWFAAVLLDVLTGLRWGELSALRWSDVDEARGVIVVSRGNYKGRVIESLKAGRPKEVPLVPELAETLRAHRRRLIAEQHPGLAAGWIFPAAGGGLHRGSPVGKVLAAACTAAELGKRVTTHGLRHTANDLMRRVTSGEVTRAIMGHSTVQMTTHYSHVDAGEKRTAAARVLAVVRADRTGDPTGDPGASTTDEGQAANDKPRGVAGLEGGAARI